MANIYKKKGRDEALTDDEMIFWLVHRALVRDDYDEANTKGDPSSTSNPL
jgi:hypothetical protein